MEIMAKARSEVANAANVLPVALKISGRLCVVVGGGPIATRKVRDLLDADARVHVVSPNITTELGTLVTNDDRVTWRAGTYEPADLRDAVLIVTATGQREIDREVFVEGERLGRLVNSADDPENCNFYLMALVRRDPVVVATTTGGTSPALASYLKRRLTNELETELGQLAVVLGEIRQELHAQSISTESLPWSSVVTDDLVKLATCGEWDAVRANVQQALGVER
jgi:siroheme synthase-like protein